MEEDRESRSDDERLEERMELLRIRIEERVREFDAPRTGFAEKLRLFLKKRPEKGFLRR